MKNNVMLRLLALCVLAGWTAGALGTVLYQETFDNGMAGTIWLDNGQPLGEWNPYFSGTPTYGGTPAGVAALYHSGSGTIGSVPSAQAYNWAYYWSRPSNSWQGWQIAAPAGTNHVEVSYDAWRSEQGWTVYTYFQVAVDFTDPVTYPREWITPNGVTVPGWQSFSASATYTGNKVVADISMYQINTQIYNDYPVPGWFIDGLKVAFDNLKVTVSGPPQNCAEALAQGWGSDADFNHDCRVNFADLEMLAAVWLDCIVPGEADCSHPWLP